MALEAVPNPPVIEPANSDITAGVVAQVQDSIAKSQAVVSNLELQLEKAKFDHAQNVGMLNVLQQLQRQGAKIVPGPVVEQQLSGADLQQMMAAGAGRTN